MCGREKVLLGNWDESRYTVLVLGQRVNAVAGDRG